MMLRNVLAHGGRCPLSSTPLIARRHLGSRCISSNTPITQQQQQQQQHHQWSCPPLAGGRQLLQRRRMQLAGSVVGTVSGDVWSTPTKRLFSTEQQQQPRESMSFDVLIVGGGPAGLAAAIRIKQLCMEKGTDLSVCLIDKGRYEYK
jgi:FAD binding domain